MHKRKETNSQYWSSFAELWENLGSPLRPCTEDQIGYQSFIDGWIEKFSRPRILILGVTPEIFHLKFPLQRELRALDRSREMIEQVWPGPREAATEGDWLQMPFADGSHDLAICDGGPLLLQFPQAHRALADELHRVLAPGGRAIFRLFTPPAKRESVEDVLEDLRRDRIGNLNILKLRLGAALQSETESGVAVQEILRTVESIETSLSQLAQSLGWTWEHLRVIEAYRESPVHYFFLNETQFTQQFCYDNHFALRGRWQGGYSLAERCPILAYERGSLPH